MKKSIIALFLITFLSSCSLFEINEEDEKPEDDTQIEVQEDYKDEDDEENEDEDEEEKSDENDEKSSAKEVSTHTEEVKKDDDEKSIEDDILSNIDKITDAATEKVQKEIVENTEYDPEIAKEIHDLYDIISTDG